MLNKKIKKIISYAQKFVILSCLLLFSTHALADFKLHEIRFGMQNDQTRIVLDISEKTSNYKVFTLNNPPRLVVDFPSYQWDTNTQIKGKQDLISTYRYGPLNPQTSRLVFETKTPIEVTNNFFLPPLSPNQANRFVIDIKPSTKTKPVITGRPKVIAKPQTTKNINKKIEKKIIVLDAGHGGKDPGAISKTNIYEKTVTLAIAKRLKKTLEETGRYNVVLTRTGDYFIRLRKRVEIAREANADLFISIHADSLHKNNVRGSSVYTLSEVASDRETARLAQRENNADVIAGVSLDEEVDEVADILIDLAMRDTMNQSKLFANLIVDSLGDNDIRLLENTHRFAGFAVLKAPDVPSILLETGYLSNNKEATLLTKASHQKKISKAITHAIDDYFAHVATLSQ